MKTQYDHIVAMLVHQKLIWSYWIITQAQAQDSCVTVLSNTWVTRKAWNSRIVWGCHSESWLKQLSPLLRHSWSGLCHWNGAALCPTFLSEVPYSLWYIGYLCMSQLAGIQESLQACLLLVVNLWVTAIRRVLFSRAHPSTTIVREPVLASCLTGLFTELIGVMPSVTHHKGRLNGDFVISDPPFLPVCSTPAVIHHLTNL